MCNCIYIFYESSLIQFYSTNYEIVCQKFINSIKELSRSPNFLDNSKHVYFTKTKCDSNIFCNTHKYSYNFEDGKIRIDNLSSIGCVECNNDRHIQNIIKNGTRKIIPNGDSQNTSNISHFNKQQLTHSKDISDISDISHMSRCTKNDPHHNHVHGIRDRNKNKNKNNNDKPEMTSEEKETMREINKKKKSIEIELEKISEKKRKFISDRDITYPRIKADIKKGMPEEAISPFFINEYNILSVMDEMEILGKDSDFDIFCEMMEEEEIQDNKQQFKISGDYEKIFS